MLSLTPWHPGLLEYQPCALWCLNTTDGAFDTINHFYLLVMLVNDLLLRSFSQNDNFFFGHDRAKHFFADRVFKKRANSPHWAL